MEAMNKHQEAWNELMELINVMKEFDLGDEAESLILSIEHLHTEIHEIEEVAV